MGIGRSLLMLVTVNALKYCIVRWIHMAGCAGAPDTRVHACINREELSIMIPRRRHPGSGAVASLTRVREIGGRMTGIRRRLIVGLMA